jgi:histidinol-phosphatase (PHP family)
MIDAHVHLERGPYTVEWLNKFIKAAGERGITEIGFLEHTHRFREFEPIYAPVIRDNTLVGTYQQEWFARKHTHNLSEYQDFIRAIRREVFPVKLRFGLEVCYFPETEKLLPDLLSAFDWDFLTGSVHFVNGWGFDHAKTKGHWAEIDINDCYQRYYAIMKQLIDSDLFHHLAHPDSIKCFGYYPDYDLTATYHKIAKHLKKQRMKAEFSLGLHLNYHHPDFGLNQKFLSVLQQEEVPLIAASDAHSPDKVGLGIAEAYEYLRLDNKD